jgi:hypothetical protein
MVRQGRLATALWVVPAVVEVMQGMMALLGICRGMLCATCQDLQWKGKTV